jgi:hypothetical protein
VDVRDRNKEGRRERGGAGERQRKKDDNEE